ncbi:MAG: cyclodeaminase/cyclohydrolase family protein [Candidatus Omnitrophica bacterium]|nr:cyclodeaminase/cyclohydrolase family protein [Candidatus Omnitrophota bacterium]
MYKDSTLKKYLDDLSAKLPAPGGGSASALSAALGVSLISMVINFTLGKSRYARYENELRFILRNSENLRKEFLRLVDLDVLAYKSKNIKKALKVPLRTADLCFKGIEFCPTLIKKANVNLISDLAVAAILLEAGFASAYFNILINLRSLKDKGLSLKINKEFKRKLKQIKKIRLKTEEEIGKIIRG